MTINSKSRLRRNVWICRFCGVARGVEKHQPDCEVVQH